MKKLTLTDLAFRKGEILTRTQLKNVLGGGGSGASGSGSGSGSGVKLCSNKCPGDDVATPVPSCDGGQQDAQCGKGNRGTCECV
jgi:hypothetical protein